MYQHSRYGYRVRIKKKEKTLEFCAVMNMTIGNSSSIRRQVTYVVAFESSLSKS